MQKFTAFTVVVLLISILSLASAQNVADTPENRMAAVKRYLEVVPLKDMMGDVASELAKNVPEENRARFVELMTKTIRIDVLEETVIRAMTKYFTVGELNALIAFYGSPEGRSAMKKLGVYMADFMPTIQQEVMRAAKSLQLDQK